ncbi:MAG: sel1 repeat family protein [Myxococcales bacterium]|nr:sel1 repeat family protein [Myxococcales bacterium]
MTKKGLVLATFGVVIAVSACGGPPDPQPPPRPPTPKVVGVSNSPYVVDWEHTNRGRLETAMRDGLVVVKFTGETFELMRDCRLEGNYAFRGMVTKQDVKSWGSADVIKANLPLGGLGIAADIGGELGRSSTLEVAEVIIGEYRTTRHQAQPGDLVGACAGATHFVQGAVVGAFAVDTGQVGKARMAAEVFGFGGQAGGVRNNKVHKVDGDFQTCLKADPDLRQPPSQCKALIQLELARLGETAQKTQTDGTMVFGADKVTASCPQGFVYAQGHCTLPQAAQQIGECDMSNAQACLERCNAGNGKSCAKLAVMAFNGLGGMNKQPQNAHMPAKKACELGEATGCAMFADLLASGVGVPKNPEAAIKLYDAACRGGADGACSSIGTVLLTGELGVRNPELGAKYLDRACRGGLQSACSNLGVQFLGNNGVEKNWPLAAQLFKNACIGDDAVGCGNYGIAAEFGIGVTKNIREAAVAYERGCKLDERECTGVAIFWHLGKGVVRDEQKAIAAYKAACAKDELTACAVLRVYLDPRVNIDVEHAKRMLPIWKGTCTSGIVRDCSALALLLHAVGEHKDGAELMLKSCQLGDDFACQLSNTKPRN